jgi:hypothetical protein
MTFEESYWLFRLFAIWASQKAESNVYMLKHICQAVNGLSVGICTGISNETAERLQYSILHPMMSPC